MLYQGRVLPPDGVEAAAEPSDFPRVGEALVAKLAHETKEIAGRRQCGRIGIVDEDSRRMRPPCELVASRGGRKHLR